MAHNGDDKLQQRIRAMRNGAYTSSRTGKVCAIRDHYDKQNVACLELEDESPPPKLKKAAGKGQAVDVSYRRRFDVEVPKADTHYLALGDRVRVKTTIEKA
jgi:hypothetical protein